MNKTTKTVALFSVLSLMAAGCQKENAADFASGAYTSEANSLYLVQYAVDGVHYQATFHSKFVGTDLIPAGRYPATLTQHRDKNMVYINLGEIM